MRLACRSIRRKYILRCALSIILSYARTTVAQATAAALSGFDAYLGGVEARLNQQHRQRATFLVTPAGDAHQRARLRAGERIVEDLTPATESELPGALLHHWRGTAFVPNAHAADFTRLLRDAGHYPQHFAPQVLQARILSRQGDGLLMQMRVRQKHVLTVVMDATYAVSFSQLDSGDGYSSSHSTQIAEIEAPGTASERALTPTENHGFLWRSDNFWSYQERDGGLYLQLESVSLSRSIPVGLGWAVRPLIQTVPRESLEFTLRSAANALRK